MLHVYRRALASASESPELLPCTHAGRDRATAARDRRHRGPHGSVRSPSIRAQSSPLELASKTAEPTRAPSQFSSPNQRNRAVVSPRKTQSSTVGHYVRHHSRRPASNTHVQSPCWLPTTTGSSASPHPAAAPVGSPDPGPQPAAPNAAGGLPTVAPGFADSPNPRVRFWPPKSL